MSVASPCTGVCSYDPGAAMCVGCGRTLDEIGAWSNADEPRRREIVSAADERLRRQALLPQNGACARR